MSDQHFNKIVELLSNDQFDIIQQGLLLLETCLENDTDAFYWKKICEVTRIFKQFTHDSWYVDQYPDWLRRAKFRRYTALWILGYRAKKNDPKAMEITSISINEPKSPTLPSTFKYLKNLEEFQLNRSEWTELPDFWDGLSNLRELDLFDNKLTKLPHSLTQCSALVKLRLRHNPIQALPDFVCTLTSLQEIDLSASKVSQLPEQIGNLSNVHTLNLESSNIQTLPDSIGQMASLKSLNLSRSNIKTLPDSIGQLSTLKHCYFFRCSKLVSLPTTIRVVHCSSELVFRLWDNFTQLTALERFEIEDWDIPRGEEERTWNFAVFPNLKHLYMKFGVFDLNSVLHCSQLEYLRISNEQTALPEHIDQLTKLKTLDLGYSKVSALPDSISNLQHLEYVYFPDTKHGFDTDAEIKKFSHLFDKHKGVAQNTTKYKKPMEVAWQIKFDNAPNSNLEFLRRKWLAKEFENIENIENLESLHVSLDANITFPNTSKCLSLKSIVIDSTETIPLSHLDLLVMGPSVKELIINADIAEFPTALLQNALGNVRVEEKNKKTKLVFDRYITIKRYSSHLEALKLRLADEQGVAKQLRHLHFVGTHIPKELATYTSLEHISFPNIPCRKIPLEVLELPNILTISGSDTNHPNEWPVWTVTYQDLENFSYLDELYQNTRVLTMRKALLKELPESILTYQKLRRLDLSFNRLVRLPENVQQWTSLEYINLAANPLETIPDSWLQLPSLKKVILPKHIASNTFASRYPSIQFTHL